MRRSASLVLAIAAGVMALGSRSFAHPDSDPAPENSHRDPNTTSPPPEITPPPPTYKANDVAVDEHLGARVPLDARFRTQDGTHVTLGQVLAGELPTILTFNYSDCPMLCSLQLNGLSAAIPQVVDDKVPLAPGRHYRIVTIDLEPNESIDKLSRMREKYLARLPANLQADARNGGWTFLVAEAPGDGTQVKRVADAVGFKYVYVPERAEWAHPAALIFLASSGMVTRYVYGIEFDTQIMRQSIFMAGTSQGAATVGFMNRCYHYDPDATSHARVGMLALRLGAASCLVLLVSGLGLAHFLRKHRRPEDINPEMKS